MKKTSLSLKKVSINDEPFWQVTVPQLGGGRQRRTFKNRAEAQTFLEISMVQQTNYGTAGLSLNEHERSEYLKACELLKPYHATISDAVNFYLPHLQAKSRSCTVLGLVDVLLEAKRADGASSRYLKDLRTRLKIFAAGFPEATVSSLTTATINSWLRALPHSATTRNNYRRLLGVLFNHGVELGYCIVNPARQASRAKVIDKPPGILSPAQCARLLEMADADILPALALGMFAGLRPEAEVWRLDWNDIDFESKLIRIEAAKTKSARHRLVEMTDNLMQWLLPHRKMGGQVSPKGDAYFTRLDRARTNAEIETWPADALRHCYGSYHYSHWQDPGRTMVQMGHTNLHTFHAHYRARVTPADASRFWDIRPTTEDKVVAMTPKSCGESCDSRRMLRPAASKQ